MISNKLRLIPALAGILSCASFSAAQAPSPAQPGHPPVVVQAEKHDMSPALRDLPVELPAEPPVFREIPRQPLPRRGPKIRTLDPLTQSSPGPEAMPSTLQNFEGVSNAAQSLVSGFSVAPPDTNGDVGPNHYVQWVNLAYAIYNKSGTLLLGPVKGNALWQGFGGACETQNDGDPIVLYDHQADRWLLSQLALPNGSSGPFYQCIAISQTGDPTGAYYRYAFKVSDSKLNDYPKFGVWPDGYYLAVNQYTCFFIFCSWAGQGTMAFERDKMLLGQPAQMVYFDLYGVDPNLGGMLPSDLDGPAPPAGSPNYFVEMDDDAWGYSPDQLQIWAFHVDWKSPMASTFTKQTALPTAAFDSNMCAYSRDCIPQPGTSSRLDAISDRLMYRLQYRNFGGYETLVTNHTVDVDGTDHAGIRWYELRKSGSDWSIYQQGTYAPADGDHRWMGSIAMDGAGNIALGFSVSSGATSPSIRYTGRLAGDPLGSMTQGEATMISGAGSQTGTNRWGDYSMMAVDSTDDCTFWYTQEYHGAPTSDANWQTRIGSFKLCAGASSGADLSVTMTDAPDPVNAGATLTYTLAVTNAGPETASTVNIMDTLPSGVTNVSASGIGWTCSGAGPVTCTTASLPVGAAQPITITATAPLVGGTITNTATISSATADPNTGNNTATAVTTINPPPSPVVDACTPSTGKRGAQLKVTVTGSNFQSGATANFGNRITVQSVGFVSAGQLDVQVNIQATAAFGSRNVTITNPDGRSGTKKGCFAVVK